MAEIKTKPNDGDVDAFLASVPDERRRADAVVVNALMAEVTGERPQLWGTNIVGFGRHRYLNGSGQGTEWFPIGYSPRKAQLVVYSMAGFERFEDVLGRLGPHSLGKACLYLRRLDKVDTAVLRELLVASVAHLRTTDLS
jgi:hypothetical protein